MESSGGVVQCLDFNDFSLEFLDDIKKPHQHTFSPTEYEYEHFHETKVNVPIKQSAPKSSYQLRELSQRIANVDALVRKIKELEEEIINFNKERKILCQNSLDIKQLYETEKENHKKIKGEFNELKSQYERLDNEHINQKLEYDQFQARLEKQNGPIPYNELAAKYVSLVQNSDNSKDDIVDKVYKYCKEQKIDVSAKKVKKKSVRSPCKSIEKKDNGTQCEITKKIKDRGTQYVTTTTTRGVNTDKEEDQLVRYIANIMNVRSRSPISPIVDPPEVSSIENLKNSRKSKDRCTMQEPIKNSVPFVQIKSSDSRPPSSMMFETVKEDSGISGSTTPLDSKSSTTEPQFTMHDFTNLWQVFGHIVCSLLCTRNTQQNQCNFIPNQCDIFGQQDFFIRMLQLYHGYQQGCHQTSCKSSASFNSSSTAKMFDSKVKKNEKHRNYLNPQNVSTTPLEFYHPKPQYKCSNSNSGMQTSSPESTQLDDEVSEFLFNGHPDYSEVPSMGKLCDTIFLEKLEKKSKKKKTKNTNNDNDNEDSQQMCNLNVASEKAPVIKTFDKVIVSKRNQISKKEPKKKIQKHSVNNVQNEEVTLKMPKSVGIVSPKEKKKVIKRAVKSAICKVQSSTKRVPVKRKCSPKNVNITDEDDKEGKPNNNVENKINTLTDINVSDILISSTTAMEDVNNFDLKSNENNEPPNDVRVCNKLDKPSLCELFGSDSEDDQILNKMVSNAKDLICNENSSSSSNFSTVTCNAPKSTDSDQQMDVITINKDNKNNVEMNSKNVNTSHTTLNSMSDLLSENAISVDEQNVTLLSHNGLPNLDEETVADCHGSNKVVSHNQNQKCQSHPDADLVKSTIFEDLNLSDSDSEEIIEEHIGSSEITAISENNVNQEKLDLTLDLTAGLFDAENNVIIPSPNTTVSSGEDREKDYDSKDELLTDIIKDIECSSNVMRIEDTKVDSDDIEFILKSGNEIKELPQVYDEIDKQKIACKEQNLPKTPQCSSKSQKNNGKRLPNSYFIAQRIKRRISKIGSIRSIPTTAILRRVKSDSIVTFNEVKRIDGSVSTLNKSQCLSNSFMDQLGKDDKHSFNDEDKNLETHVGTETSFSTNNEKQNEFNMKIEENSVRNKMEMEVEEEIGCQKSSSNLDVDHNNIKNHIKPMPEIKTSINPIEPDEDSLEERLVIDEQYDDVNKTEECNVEPQFCHNNLSFKSLGTFDNNIWDTKSINSESVSSRLNSESSDLSSSDLSSAESITNPSVLPGTRRGRKRKSDVQLPTVCKRSARLLAKLHGRPDDTDGIANVQENCDTNYKCIDLGRKCSNQTSEECLSVVNDAAADNVALTETPVNTNDKVVADYFASYESPTSPAPESIESIEPSTIVQIPLDMEKSINKHESTSFIEEILKCHGMSKSKNIFNNTVCKSSAKLLKTLKKIIVEYLGAETVMNNSVDAIELVRKMKKITNDHEIIISAIIAQIKDAPRPEIELSCEINNVPPKTLSSSHQRISHVLNILTKTESADYISGFLGQIESMLFNVSQVEKQSLDEAMNLTQLYLLILSNEMYSMTNSPARLFIAKCLYFHNMKALPMMYEVMTVFPTVLPHREERSYDRSDPLISVIQHILMCYVYDMNNNDLRCKELLSKLRYEYHFEPFKPTQDEVLQNLMAKFEANKLTNLTYAFALLCKRYTPKRTTIQVLQPHLLPLADKYYQLSLKSSDYDDRIAAILECISMVIKPFPIEMNIDSYLTIFTRFLHTIDRPLVQEAALQAILRTQRFGYTNCFNALQNFNPTYQLGNQTRAMLRTFIQRKPLKFWRSLIRNASVGAIKVK